VVGPNSGSSTGQNSPFKEAIFYIRCNSLFLVFLCLVLVVTSACIPTMVTLVPPNVLQNLKLPNNVTSISLAINSILVQFYLQISFYSEVINSHKDKGKQ